MLQIPVAVERMHHHIECVKNFFLEGSLSALGCSILVYLGYIAESLCEEEEHNDYDGNDNEEVFAYPFSAKSLVGVGVISCRIGCLEILHCLLVFALLMEVSAYADISGIEVVVSLQNFSPVFESRGVNSQSVVVEFIVDDIAVLCSLINSNGACLGVYNIEVGAEVRESRALLEVAELCALIAESEEHISLGIVCVNLGALLIEYRPHSVRTDSNIHYRGRTRDNITAALFRGAVKVDFTGGNEEAVSRRDIVARGIHSLYRSIVRVAAFNGADEVCIIHAV